MPSLRVYGVDLTSPTAPSLRVYQASATGTNPTTPALRIYDVSVTGAGAAVLDPLLDQTVEPLSTVSITAVLSPGSATPDDYVFRQISGPPIAFSGTGATRTFEAPAAMPPGTSVVIGVTALVSGVPSTERTCTVAVLPQLSWTRVPGGNWVAAKKIIS